jgi:shikimate dehydrogenase
VAEGGEILGTTRLIGLIGDPVDHSMSPVFMNRALDILGLDFRYVACPVTRGELERALAGARALGFLGLNVTIPHKREILAFLDRVDEHGERIGAVNCVRFDGTRAEGYNTDHLGFAHPLERTLSPSTRALLIGCGGAARGVAYALSRLGVSVLTLLNRSEDNAAAFVSWCRSTLGFSSVSFGGDPGSTDPRIVESHDLIVNSTPVGMHPAISACPLPRGVRFREDQTVYDLVYNPPETVLLQRARRDGARTLGGLPMLVSQGLHALAVWFPRLRSDILVLQERMEASLSVPLTRRGDGGSGG